VWIIKCAQDDDAREDARGVLLLTGNVTAEDAGG
jgi:hypothetical protein